MIAIIFRIGRPAIYAPEITPVRYRNAQVRDLPPEFVSQIHPCPEIKNPTRRVESGGWRKYAYFRPAHSFPNPIRRHRRISAGGSGVSTGTLNLLNSSGIALVATGFLSRPASRVGVSGYSLRLVGRQPQ